MVFDHKKCSADVFRLWTLTKEDNSAPADSLMIVSQLQERLLYHSLFVLIQMQYIFGIHLSWL